MVKEVEGSCRKDEKWWVREGKDRNWKDQEGLWWQDRHFRWKN